ncbi:carbohydrate ABC transporter permease [uncultured Clostridium sp.]|uniref:carbohydrate ABC transporter permease n=1 Tax=uncultured Clostridium sp. TaxID=59620 RepID=UPI00262A6A4D|nr:carbohydrate ABC transporter permease [uncultured Clostridium sp.]
MKRKKIEMFDIILGIVLLFVAIITLYPFLNILAISFNNGLDTLRGGIGIWPREFTLDNYAVVFSNSRVISSFIITLSRTIVGTITSVLFTAVFSYAMSKPYLKFKRFYMTLCIITMYFGGGMIPNFVLMQKLHLTNNYLVYIIPGLLSVWNMILMITFFKGIPAEIEESAKLDGAGDFIIFIKLIIPVSTPIIAVIALYNAIGNWNSWFDAFLYIQDRNLYPLQIVLKDIINSNSIGDMLPAAQQAASNAISHMSAITTKSITAATMMVTIGPIILVYPFLQKYFLKGVMIGSIKG